MNNYVLVLLAGILFFFSCRESDIEIQTNELGSQLEIRDDIKVSTFYLSNDRLKIEKLTDFTMQFVHQESENVYGISGRFTELSPKLKCELYIPKNKSLPDGDYVVRFSTTDNEVFFTTRFTLALRNEMVAAVRSETADYAACLKGGGTKDDPFLIGTKLDLTNGDDFRMTEFFRVLSSDPTHAAGLYFKQISDIQAERQGFDLNGNGHIGQAFGGNYDGSNYKIKVTYRGTGSKDDDNYVGFFSMLSEGAIISNVSLDVSIEGGYSCIGALAGLSEGDIALSNISFQGSINGFLNVGGLIGKTVNGDVSIQNVSMDSSIKASGGNDISGVGGLIGESEGATLQIDSVTAGTRFKIECLSSSAGTSNNNYTGGLMGNVAEGHFEISRINLMYKVSGENDPVIIHADGPGTGGLVGRTQIRNAGRIINSIVDVPISGGNNTGGFIGKVECGERKYVALYLLDSEVNTPKIQGMDHVGGFVGAMGDVELGELTNLQQNASIYGNECVGGIIGHVEITNSEIWNMIALADMEVAPQKGVISGKKFVGGIVGFLKTENYEKHIIHLYTSVKINDLTTISGDDSVGGLFGAAFHCQFVGRVSFTEDQNTTIKDQSGESSFSAKINNVTSSATSCGGLFGYANNCIISNLMSEGTVYGGKRVGGIVGHAQYTQLYHCIRKGGEVFCNIENGGGICGRADNSTLKHRNLVNFSRVVGNDRTGGVFGYVYATEGTLEHLVNAGSVEGKGSVGGVIGQIASEIQNGHLNNIYLKSSANFGQVSGSCNTENDYGLGGVIGISEHRVHTSECVNHGKVIAAANSAFEGVGGVAGFVCTRAMTFVKFTSCCNKEEVRIDGAVTSKRITLGGVVGRLDNGYNNPGFTVMSDCYNQGYVFGKCNDDIGGVLGTLNGRYALIEQCVNSGEVSQGQGDPGNAGVGTHESIIYNISNIFFLEGTGKDWKADSFSNSNKKNKSTFEDFSFGDIWKIDDNDINGGFPYLVNCYYQFAKKPEL